MKRGSDGRGWSFDLLFSIDQISKFFNFGIEKLNDEYGVYHCFFFLNNSKRWKMEWSIFFSLSTRLRNILFFEQQLSFSYQLTSVQISKWNISKRVNLVFLQSDNLKRYFWADSLNREVRNLSLPDMYTCIFGSSYLYCYFI